MEIINKSIDDLIPYANNARLHEPEQINQIASSIKEFGFNNPILIDKDNGIIAGHGRLEAAKKLGLTEVPTIMIEHLTNAQKKAFILADNRIALNSKWDYEILAIEFENVADEIDLSNLGFDINELTNLIDPVAEKPVNEQEYEQKFSIIIDCEDEAEQERIFNELDEKGYKCRVQSL